MFIARLRQRLTCVDVNNIKENIFVEHQGYAPLEGWLPAWITVVFAGNSHATQSFSK
jgi:hypothetical protein